MSERRLVGIHAEVRTVYLLDDGTAEVATWRGPLQEVAMYQEPIEVPPSSLNDYKTFEAGPFAELRLTFVDKDTTRKVETMTAPKCKGCGKVITGEPVRDTAGTWHASCLEDQVAGHEADERTVEVRE